MERLSSALFLFVKAQTCLLVLLVVLPSCNESKELQDAYLGYDYFPLEIGRYSVYEVEEIQYLVAGFDTSRYFVKETIFDSAETAGGVEYFLKREIRSTLAEPWTMDSLYAISLGSSYLAVKRNNRWVIDLAFPIRTGKTWDANGLNGGPLANRFYEDLEQPLIDSINFEDQIKVVLANIEENITGVDMRSEIYVRGIGLVQRDYLTQTTCTASDCGDDLGIVIAGRSLKQLLIETGYEG